MKKIIALILAATLIFSVTACSEKPATETPDVDTENTQNETDDSSTNDTTESTDGTVGEILSKDFKDRVTADSSLSAQAIADELVKNSVLQFGPAVMPVEPGLLTGFDNTEINGFKEGVMFAPMIGTIPFVGYVFVLEDGADVESFKTTLSDSANLRWNICTEAEEKIVENVGNTVFFLMCPKSLEA